MNTSQWAQAVKERDGWRCQDCGATDNLHAHHIKPQALGGDNTLDNGVTLCEPHHRAQHTGKVSTVAMARTDGVPKHKVSYILGISSATVQNWQNSGKLPDNIDLDTIRSIIDRRQVKIDRMKNRFHVVKQLA